MGFVVAMGFPSDLQKNGGGGGSLNTLVRRKQVDSNHVTSSGNRQYQLARALTAPHLIAIGKERETSSVIQELKDVALIALCFLSVLWLAV